MMKFWNSKPERAAEVREIPLGNYSEAALLLVLAGLFPQSSIAAELETVLGPVTDGLRAELQSRWLKRGKTISIQLPARLPAVIIEACAQLFICMQENLRPQVIIARAAGPLLAPTLEQIEGAEKIAATLLGALRESRVEIRVPEDLPASLS